MSWLGDSVMTALAMNKHLYAPTFIMLHDALSSGVYPPWLRKVARNRAVSRFDQGWDDPDFEDEYNWVHNVWKGEGSCLYAPRLLFLTHHHRDSPL
jgi:hypothetical protein